MTQDIELLKESIAGDRKYLAGLGKQVKLLLKTAELEQKRAELTEKMAEEQLRKQSALGDDLSAQVDLLNSFTARLELAAEQAREEFQLLRSSRQEEIALFNNMKAELRQEVDSLIAWQKIQKRTNFFSGAMGGLFLAWLIFSLLSIVKATVIEEPVHDKTFRERPAAVQPLYPQKEAPMYKKEEVAPQVAVPMDDPVLPLESDNPEAELPLREDEE